MEKSKGPKLSIYVSEELKTRFKIACTAKQISMNEVLVRFIEEWTEENDPMKTMQKPTPGNGKVKSKKGGENE